MSFLIIILCSIYFINQNVHIGIIYVLCTLSGIGVAVGLLIPWSMLPDVVDLDELNTNKRREGELYSIFLLFHKIGLGIALAISSYSLGLAGYHSPSKEPNDNQPESVILLLQFMLSFIPAFILFLSLIAAYFYPLTKEKHQKILEKLKKIQEENLIK